MSASGLQVLAAPEFIIDSTEQEAASPETDAPAEKTGSQRTNHLVQIQADRILNTAKIGVVSRRGDRTRIVQVDGAVRSVWDPEKLVWKRFLLLTTEDHD